MLAGDRLAEFVDRLLEELPDEVILFPTLVTRAEEGGGTAGKTEDGGGRVPMETEEGGGRVPGEIEEGGSRISVPLPSDDLNSGKSLLLEKVLTKTDVSTKLGMILLPKKSIQAHFPVTVKEGQDIKMQDGQEEGRTWMMRLVADPVRKCGLRNSRKYLAHHALKQGDKLRIFFKERPALYVLHFQRV